MALIADLIRGKASQKRPDWPDVALRAADAERWTVPDYALANNQEGLYRKLSWVNIAVSFVARACAAQALNVKRYVAEDTEDIVNHPFEMLLRRPNPSMSRQALLYATHAYKLLTGNAYWWMNKPGQTAPPDELWVIPSHQIKPIPDGNLYIAGYEYDPGTGKTETLPPEQIVHFKDFNPHSWLVGQSRIEAAAIAAEGDLAMQRWNRNYFGKNNAKVPGALLFAERIPDSDWLRLQEDFKREYGGTERQMMMLRGVGAGGVQWTQMSLTQDDMQFLQGRQFSKEELYALFGVPAGMLDKNATEANASAGKAVFSEYTVWPALTAVAEVLTNNLLPLYGENLTCEFEDPRKSDRLVDLQEQVEFARYHTLNEVRQLQYQAKPLPPDDPRGEMLVAEVAPGIPHSKAEQDAAKQAEADAAAQALELAQARQQQPAQQEQPDGEAAKGGPGSGHWGHAGRIGEEGGSLPGDMAMSVATGKDAAQRQAAAAGRDGKGYKPARGTLALQDTKAFREYGTSYYQRGAHGDEYLNAVQREQGFDGLPTVVTEDELGALIASGDAIGMYRGEAEAAYAEQWRTGGLYSGEGNYGSGTYAAEDIETAREYAWGTGEAASESGQVMHIGLRSDARIADASVLEAAREAALKAELAPIYAERDKALAAATTANQRGRIEAFYNNQANALLDKPRLRDSGVQAALQGYDAIRASARAYVGGEHLEWTYYVILNRTACYVSKGGV